MKKDDAGAILAEMNSTLAAKLTLLIYPVSE
jgi:flagellar motility protein MotE (MotC chaperone)